MKIKRLLIPLFILATIMLSAQNQVTLDHNGTPSIYSTITNAINDAVDGDHIYISGGNFTESLTIDKELHIYGAGHYSDSTEATYFTKVTGTITLISDASHSSITGLYISSAIMIGTNDANDSINELYINRCNMRSLILSMNSGSNNSGGQNIFITENIIRGHLIGGADTLVYIEKNIIQYQVQNFKYTQFRNNIFLWYGDYLFGYDGAYVSNCNFYNNIILDNTPISGWCTYNYFYNNLFVYNVNFPLGTNLGFDNFQFYPVDSIFVNQTGNTFSYSHDYHLNPNCAGVGAGYDSFDVGIYGTGEPYKEGAVPINPHVRSHAVSVQNNQISVEIEVGAQDK